jgi:serine/threonine protein kinase/predicted negative regulator of RcsB-dependent stress response
MTPIFDDLPQLSQLLDEALELPVERIDEWIASLPPEKAHLRSPLREMLDLHHSQAHAAFLSSGPHLEAGIGDAATDAGVGADPGDLVGPYRLVREIGRGGMGAVWLADRVDGALKRQVALKLPRLAWGERLAERMARERDIGALLEHPNIARLYDAGVDQNGRPYLALEFIDGQPVDVWCNEHDLSVRERLRVFLQIARAVAYAHGRLVVHRDLKPSNVLVTADGQAHLLDFGIARLLQESVPIDEHPTQEMDRVLTPQYASPEQLRGEAITVSSDVYSLGVLLFELLTGRLPHQPSRKGMAALEKAVLEDEPPLASSRALEHRTVKALRGEVDAIVMKALKRDPDERYATADALAEDIERHLGGERVLAQRDSLTYRLIKTLQRYRVGFTAAGAVAVAVLAGTAIALVQAKRANDEADRARVVKEFVIEVFKVNEHGQPANTALRQLPVELLLERGAGLIEARFKGQPQLQAELYGVVGGIFAGMGASESAAVYATRQLESQASLGASASEQAQATLLLAQALLAQGRNSDAKSMAQSALVSAESDPLIRPKVHLLLAHVLLHEGHTDEGMRELDEADREMKDRAALAIDAARAKALRASMLIFADKFDEARPIYSAAIDEAITAEGPSSPAAIDIRLIVASNLALQGRNDEARAPREAALKALRAGGGAGELRAALEESDIDTTLFLTRQMRFDEAKAAIERDRSMIAMRGPLVPQRIKATIDLNLGRTYLEWGDFERADPLISSSIATLQPQADSIRDRYLYAELQGVAAMYSGRHDEADRLFKDELAMQKVMGGDRHPERVFDYARRALNRSMQGRFDEAEAILATAPAFAAIKGADHATMVGYRELGSRAMARIKQDRGESTAALALLPATDADETVPFPFDHLLLRGEVLCDIGRRDEGLALIERSLEMHQEKDYEHSPHLARARGLAGLCALAVGKRDRAVELATLASASLQDQPDVSDYFKRPLARLEDLIKLPAARSKAS